MTVPRAALALASLLAVLLAGLGPAALAKEDSAPPLHCSLEPPRSMRDGPKSENATRGNWSLPHVNDTDAPRFLAWGPAGLIREARPTIFAQVEDACGVLPSGYVLRLDGVEVFPSASTGEGFAFAPPRPLSTGRHLVEAAARDPRGNVQAIAWDFRVVEADVPGERAVAALAHAPAGARRDIHFTDPTLAIARIEITPRASHANFTLTVRELASLPPLLGRLPVAAARIVEVSLEADRPPEGERARIHLQASPAWAQARGGLPSQAILFRAAPPGWAPVTGSAPTSGAGPGSFEVESELPALLALGLDTERPAFDSGYPEAGVILNAPPARLTLRVTDNLPLDPQRVSLSLGGTRLPTTLSSGIASAAVPQNLPDGRHLVSARAVDAGENVGETSWAFLIDRTGPDFPSVAPEGRVSAARPHVTVVYVDPVSGVDPGTVRVRLDGEDVTRYARITGGGVTLVPPSNLTLGAHVIEVHVQDRAGNAAVKSHAFEVAAATPAPGALAAIAGLALLARLLRGARRRG